MSYSCRYNRPGKCIAAFLILLQAGCAQPRAQSEFAGTAPAATTVNYCLAMLNRFNSADTETRAVMYEQVSTEAVLEPTASNRLQLALLKSWPGHPGYNAEAARQLLQTALAQPSELTPATENLARVQLLIVEQQLQTANRNRVLAAELEEARNKLTALTRIERTVETAPRTDPSQ